VLLHVYGELNCLMTCLCENAMRLVQRSESAETEMYVNNRNVPSRYVMSDVTNIIIVIIIIIIIMLMND
jgi:hypothetical protein